MKTNGPNTFSFSFVGQDSLALYHILPLDSASSLWLPDVQVDDPQWLTLANNQRVIVLKPRPLRRFDIVVAKEVENGKDENKSGNVSLVRITYGDTITYQKTENNTVQQ